MRAPVLCSVLLTACTVTKPGENGYQDYVLMGTPTYENAVGRPSEPVQLEMIAAMLPSVKVGLVAQDDVEGDAWRVMLSENGVSDSDLENLVVFPIEHTDLWFRDMGGVFVQLDVLGYDTLAVVDFEFDGWGYGPISDDFYRELYAIDNLVAPQLGDAMGLPVIYSPLIFEAGALGSNGKGTIAYSWPAVNQRNPTWTQEAVAAEFERVLGAKKVIPMPYFHPADGHSVVDGPLELDGRYLHYPYGVRHTDEYMAFVDEHTIVVNQLPQEAVTNWIEQEIHDRMQATWDFLETQTDQDGDPFTLIAFPDPGMITDTMTADDIIWQGLGTMAGLQNYDPAGGEVIMPASYMNYVVTNGVVLAPQFYDVGRSERLIETDAEVITLLQALYPDREVIGVDSDNIAIGGGGMHCITQEVRSLSDFPSDDSDDDDSSDDDSSDDDSCDEDDGSHGH
ncbi:MAG: agmatine deiminase family protein [Myxococcota bacterium]